MAEEKRLTRIFSIVFVALILGIAGYNFIESNLSTKRIRNEFPHLMKPDSLSDRIVRIHKSERNTPMIVYISFINGQKYSISCLANTVNDTMIGEVIEPGDLILKEAESDSVLVDKSSSDQQYYFLLYEERNE